MKLFIVTCIKEYQEEVYTLFKRADIKVFSAANIVGFKDAGKENVLLEWFATGEEKLDSLMLFSFTSEENAKHGLQIVDAYNQENNSTFPIRAFIVPVEGATNQVTF